MEAQVRRPPFLDALFLAGGGPQLMWGGPGADSARHPERWECEHAAGACTGGRKAFHESWGGPAAWADFGALSSEMRGCEQT